MLESRDNQLKPMRQGLQCVYDSLMLKCRRFCRSAMLLPVTSGNRAARILIGGAAARPLECSGR